MEDYSYLYEKNKEHGMALREDERAFLHGLSEAHRQTETFLDNYKDIYEHVEEEVSPTLSRIVGELREDVIRNFRDWLRMTWREIFMTFLDTTEGDDNTGKLSQSWTVPEPPKEEEKR